MPDSTICYYPNLTNAGLGLHTYPLDSQCEKLWIKYNKHLSNQYYIIDPSFKRGTYQKADMLYRKYYHVVEKTGDYEVWIKNGDDNSIAFYNKKTKQWISNNLWHSWEE